MKRNANILFVLVAALVVGACASSPEATKVADTSQEEMAEEEGFDGHQRLPDTVEPTAYRIELSVDPNQETFSGEVAIDVDIAEALARIDLHAEDIDFERAEFVRGDERRQLEVVYGQNGGVSLFLDEPVEAGEATLEFAYEAPLDEQPHGLYRVQDNEEWYAFSQFQPLEARQAFPSFDEPGFKTPFDVTLRVPEELVAISNTPEQDSQGEDGWKRVDFEETKPLPTYLVAFAVGDFDVVEAPEDAIEGVPLRAVATKGKGELAEYALEQAPGLLEAQIEYFGIEFPFEKIDLVAVPNFSAGAMENVGLVTFRERLLLLDEADATAGDMYALQSVMAHEFAHMWFGNYTTPAWWDDLWLNEAFATWMATKTLVEVAPEFEPRIDAVQGTLQVMNSDALASARAIRQPIREGGDVYNAFDSITYTKGRAVLQMLETWMGEEEFRDGVRLFLERNAFDSGTTDELVEAWEEVSGEPVEATLRRFIDQPGVPLVEVEPSCEEGQTTLEVSQERFVPVGGEAEQERLWRIPVCLRYEVDGSIEETCRLVEEEETSVELDTDSCAAWIHPNADESGYYHWGLPGDALTELASTHRSKLSMPERVALLPHTEALVEAQRLDFDAYLEVVEAMAEEEHRAIVEQVVDALYEIEEIAIEEGQQEAFEQWAGELLAPHVDRLGFSPREDEPVDDALLRPEVMQAAVELGGDDELAERALEVTRTYLDAPDEVPMSQANYALSIAAYHDGEGLWQALRDAVSEARTPAARNAIISALGKFQDPELVRDSLDLYLSDALRGQDFWTVAGPTLEREETAEVTWSWLQEHYEQVVDKMGKKAAPSLPWFGAAFCSEERADEVEAFFGDEERQVPGQSRNLAKALESIEQCVRYREYVADDLRRFFE